MKQKPDEIRVLAVELFDAGQREKRKQSPQIWGNNRYLRFESLPCESVAVWDAIAIAAIRKLSK